MIQLRPYQHDALHAYAHGLKVAVVARGEDHVRAVLTAAEVREIKLALGMPYRGQVRDLGRLYGVHRSTIGYIKRGRLWGHVNV